ncbi:chloride channel protein [Spirosoma spitsbergense]|uniref:chloride channel protein n=1 Tax=Spirosoma spitsbergense TaxID=431554 RepID=UPI0003A3E503|nr:chloride channel protein [Spirosoma spitsbergense]
MHHHHIGQEPIPISTSLRQFLNGEPLIPKRTGSKKRILYIAMLAVGLAGGVALIARLLVGLINLVTNLSFFGRWSLAESSPADATLGLWVIALPAVGGIIVGLMAFYGSKAIRGHGIPEAMEQILVNKSRIKPIIAFLKPLSAAISIGTGGPFGAEGPIIATGGALGSTIGQILTISDSERKTLLAAGATAGMATIFGTPLAAIFLAIELLLFEFSARSIIPVALACVTGAAGHHLLFGTDPVFAVSEIIPEASNAALLAYSAIGLLIGVLSVAITKLVYFIEDGFEKLPLHWMWWPALGGLAVGLIGYVSPKTLGVGYRNITDILSGTMPVSLVLSLCLFKLLSWSISLGSGTSGGTLAPLLTIGGAIGALAGHAVELVFPGLDINLPLAALVGMSALFAGASRAVLTSIVFALETTRQTNSLLPLLAACVGSYSISFLLMENTIMTEKIARRGTKTPDSYEPDWLEKWTVGEVSIPGTVMLTATSTLPEVYQYLRDLATKSQRFVVVDSHQQVSGLVSLSTLVAHPDQEALLSDVLAGSRYASISPGSSLQAAVDLMTSQQVDMLAVVSADNQIVSILDYDQLFSAYQAGQDEQNHRKKHISVRRSLRKRVIAYRRAN